MDVQDKTQEACDGFCTGVVNAGSARDRALAWLGVLFPIGIFWAACIRYLSPLPVADDYDAVLLFLVHLRQLPTHGAQFAMLLLEQHNEYKLVWLNALVVLQYKLAGHVSFIALSLLGDLQVMLLAWLLWKIFARGSVRGRCRLALFVPVALVVFQPNYAETLDWPMAAIQNLGVLTFALLSLWLLERQSNASFAGACGGLVLAIAASGNGFFLLPVGLFMLWQQRRYTRMVVWTLTTTVCAAVYFHHYARFQPDPAHVTHPGLHPIFILSFLGSFAGVKLPVVRFASLPAGALVLACLVFAAVRGYFRRNPAMAGFALFLLITALGVSVTRGGLPYGHSLSGRYKIYGDLLLVCLYSFGLEFLKARPVELRRRAFRWSAAVACLIFLFGTAFGLRAFRTRHRSLNQGLAIYRASGGTDGPVPVTGTAEERDDAAAMNVHFRDALRQAAAADVYHLP